MGGSVSDSFRFGDSYRISELCELVHIFKWLILAHFYPECQHKISNLCWRSYSFRVSCYTRTWSRSQRMTRMGMAKFPRMSKHQCIIGLHFFWLLLLFQPQLCVSRWAYNHFVFVSSPPENVHLRRLNKKTISKKKKSGTFVYKLTNLRLWLI